MMTKEQFAKRLNKKHWLELFTPEDDSLIHENHFIVCFYGPDGNGCVYIGSDGEIDLCDIDWRLSPEGQREVVWLYGNKQPSNATFEIWKDGEYWDTGFIFDYKEVITLAEKRYVA